MAVAKFYYATHHLQQSAPSRDIESIFTREPTEIFNNNSSKPKFKLPNLITLSQA